MTSPQGKSLIESMYPAACAPMSPCMDGTLEPTSLTDVTPL
jgi:hypothetical protein